MRPSHLAWSIAGALASQELPITSNGARVFAGTRIYPAACLVVGFQGVRMDVEIVRGRFGPPHLELSERGRARLAEIGGDRVLVSLTHGREHAAAAVLVLGGSRG